MFQANLIIIFLVVLIGVFTTETPSIDTYRD